MRSYTGFVGSIYLDVEMVLFLEYTKRVKSADIVLNSFTGSLDLLPYSLNYQQDTFFGIVIALLLCIRRRPYNFLRGKKL